MNLRVGLAALCVAGFVALPARADLAYSYGTDLGTGGSGVNTTATYGPSGSTVTISLYLNESISKGSQSMIGPGGSESGLFGAGVAINVVSGTSTISSVSLNTNSATATGVGPTSAGFGTASSFSATNVAANGSSAAILDSINLGGTAPRASQISSTLNQIYLGSVTINVVGTTTFSVTSFGTSSNSFALSQGDVTQTSPSGYALDQDGTGPAGVNFTGTEDVSTTFIIQTAAVPEPSSMALCGLAVVGLGVGYWRRRQTRVADAVAVDAEMPAIA